SRNGQTPDQHRPRDDLADERGSDVGPVEKQSAEHPLARRAPDPAESRGAHDHLSIGRRLGEENGRLEGALAPADDDDACTREIRERDWPCDPGDALSLKGVERKRSRRITDVRRAPGAPEEHAARHVLLPERHRRSEHAYVDAALTKVRGCGEPVWPRTNHHDIRSSHLLPPPKAPLRVSHERTAKSKRVSASMSPLTASALRASRGQRHRRTSGPEER